MRVKATQTGFYLGSRRRPGAEFVLTDPKHFSAKWMKKLEAEKPAVNPPGPGPNDGKPKDGKPAK